MNATTRFLVISFIILVITVFFNVPYELLILAAMLGALFKIFKK